MVKERGLSHDCRKRSSAGQQILQFLLGYEAQIMGFWLPRQPILGLVAKSSYALVELLPILSSSRIAVSR